MDHRTRVWSALHFREVDRVPFDLFDTAGYLFREGLYDPAQRLTLSLQEQVAARLRSHQEFDADLMVDTPVLAQGSVPYTIHLTPPFAQRYELLFAAFPIVSNTWHPWPPTLRPKPGVDLEDDEAIELVATWANGPTCHLTLETAAGTLGGYEKLMEHREEWPLWQAILEPRFEAFDYQYVRQVVHATGGDIGLYGTICGPYSMFATVFGLEQSTYLLHDEPGFARSVMMWLTDVTIEVGRDMIRHGVDILRVGEATASLLSPTLYRRHVQEHHRRMNQALVAAGGSPVLHICGRSNSLLEAVADAGTPGLETLTPPPLGNVDLADAKRRIGNRVCLKGNLDPVHVVGALTPGEVAAATQRCLEAGSVGGGFVLSVADDMVRGTPLANLQAIAEVVHGYHTG
jgi:hypothetical protein